MASSQPADCTLQAFRNTLCKLSVSIPASELQKLLVVSSSLAKRAEGSSLSWLLAGFDMNSRSLPLQEVSCIDTSISYIHIMDSY